MSIPAAGNSSLSPDAMPAGYRSDIDKAPVGVELSVMWGSGVGKTEFGRARLEHGKWWNYSETNPHANGRGSVLPAAWHPRSHLDEMLDQARSADAGTRIVD